MRLVIAEDSVLLRAGLTRLLEEEGHHVLAGLGDATGLLAAVDEHRPDVVVIDVRMPPTHTTEGLRAALELRERSPSTGILVLSQYVETQHAARLLAGAPERIGYLLKDRISEVGDFLDALERIHAGGAAFDPEVVRQLLARTTRIDPLARLSDRERAVLELTAQGLTNAAVAERLHVAVSTVEKHVNAVFDKLDLPPTPGYSRRMLAVLRYLNG